MYCSSCGKNIPAESVFCGYCGNNISQKPAASASTSSPVPPPSATSIPPNSVLPPATTDIFESLSPIAGRPVSQRETQPQPADGSKFRRSPAQLILLRVLAAIVLVAIVAFILLTRGTDTESSASITPTVQVPIPATGIGTAVPNEGNAHVAEGSAIIYNVYPPSSGPHYPSTAPYGFSDVEIPEGYFVHSMEHGAVVLYYRPDVSGAVKQQLKELFTKLTPNKNGNLKLVITPYTKGMTTPLAIAAWNRLLLMKEYNFDEIRTFYQTWVDKGPESTP